MFMVNFLTKQSLRVWFHFIFSKTTRENQPLNYFTGDALKDKEVLDRLLGRNKEEQELKIKERLEKRKQRLAEGIRNKILL